MSITWDLCNSLFGKVTFYHTFYFINNFYSFLMESINFYRLYLLKIYIEHILFINFKNRKRQICHYISLKNCTTFNSQKMNSENGKQRECIISNIIRVLYGKAKGKIAPLASSLLFKQQISCQLNYYCNKFPLGTWPIWTLCFL